MRLALLSFAAWDTQLTTSYQTVNKHMTEYIASYNNLFNSVNVFYDIMAESEET